MVKNIIICLDGTGNSLTTDSTNVWNIYCTLPESEDQIKFYDAGCGTTSGIGVQTVLGNNGHRLLDTVFGYGVKRQACAGYKYLVDHYSSGDRIYLFGFSRGAYSCRVLAAMLYTLGLIAPGRDHLIYLGWDIFDSDLNEEQKAKNLLKFKHSFARNHCRQHEHDCVENFHAKAVKVHMMGVWDTVSAYGILRSFERHPFTEETYDSITHIRHAMALDERRGMFRPFLFAPMDGKTDGADRLLNGATTFREMWFRGCHSDVGGGQPEEYSGLSKVALEWMFREIDKLPRNGELRLIVNPISQGHFLGFSSPSSSEDAFGKMSADKQIRPDYNQDPTESLNTWYFELMEMLLLRVYSREQVGPRLVWSERSICSFLYDYTVGWCLQAIFCCVPDEQYSRYLSFARSVFKTDSEDTQSASHEQTPQTKPSATTYFIEHLMEPLRSLPFWSFLPSIEDSKQHRGMALTGPNWWSSREELLHNASSEYERVVGVVNGVWLSQSYTENIVQSEKGYRSKLAWRCDPARLQLAKRIHNYICATTDKMRHEEMSNQSSLENSSEPLHEPLSKFELWNEFSKEAGDQALVDKYMLVLRGAGNTQADTIGDLPQLSEELEGVLAERLLKNLTHNCRQHMKDDLNILILYLEYKADGNPTNKWPMYLTSLMNLAQRNESNRNRSSDNPETSPIAIIKDEGYDSTDAIDNTNDQLLSGERRLTGNI